MKSPVWISTVMLSGLAMMGCAAGRPATHRPAEKVVVVRDTPGPGATVVVKVRPPSPRKEVRSRRPSRRHVWVPGYWDWRGHSYVWVKGHWTVPPRVGLVWVPGQWVARQGGWIFIAGHWR